MNNTFLKKFSLYFIPNVLFLYLISAINSPLFFIEEINLINIINFFRSISPIIIFFVFFFLLIFKKNFSLIFLLFSFFLLSTLVGFFLSKNQIFFNLYWTFSALSLVCFLEYYQDEETLLKNFHQIILIIFSIIAISIVSRLVVDDFYSYQNFYAHKIMSPSQNFFNQPVPRSSGVARILLVIFLFLFSFVVINNKKKLKNCFCFVILFIISYVIWIIQNRGTLYFLIILNFLTLIISIIYQNKNLFIKWIVIFLLPFVFVQSLSLKINRDYDELIILNKHPNPNVQMNEAEKIKLDILNNHSLLSVNQRWKTPIETSGRLEIWKKSYEIIKKYPFFGNGPQSDRQMLGLNASNIVIYVLLCGGLFSLIIFLIFIYYLLKDLLILLKKIIFQNLYLELNNFFIIYSFLLIFFLGFRGIVENSFSVFSLDMLLFLLSIKYIYKFKDFEKKY